MLFRTRVNMTRASSVARLWSTEQPDSNAKDDGTLCVSAGVPPPAAPAAVLELNLRNYGVGLEVKGNNSIRYIGNGSHSTDVGAIQTSQPVPSCASVFYYELTVVEKGERGYLSLGFADRAFKLNRQCGYVLCVTSLFLLPPSNILTSHALCYSPKTTPDKLVLKALTPGTSYTFLLHREHLRWENNSYGYHGDDGKKYSGSGLGTHYGPTFTTGDVVGAGLHTETNEIFFTKNGEWLGVAFRDVCITPLYPTVGLHSKDERVSTNFGSDSFAFDIETYVAEEKAKRTVSVAAEDIPASVTHELVRDYLEYHGYAKTLRALDRAAAARDCDGGGRGRGSDDATIAAAMATTSVKAKSSNDVNNGVKKVKEEKQGDEEMKEEKDDEDNEGDLWRRAQAHALLLAGDVDGAERHLRAEYPEFFELESDLVDEVRVHLSCQQYVEIVRSGDLAGALEYARVAMPGCVGLDPSWDEAIRNVVALAAYRCPDKSLLSPLLTPAHRDRVADAINAAVLAAAHTRNVIIHEEGGENKRKKTSDATPGAPGDNDSDDGDDEEEDDEYGDEVYDEEEDDGEGNGDGFWNGARGDNPSGTGTASVSVKSNSRVVVAGVTKSFDVPTIGAPAKAAALGLGSKIEMLLRQILIAAQELRAVNGGKGEVFELVSSDGGA